MINIVKEINEAEFVTHTGNFHADDVFSTVLLEKLFDNINLIRLKSYNDDNTKIAYDIGMGKFDHHQFNSKKRKSGIHYCGFGLLWQEYGRKYLEKINVLDIEETFEIVDYLLVNMIDAIDNGECNISLDYNVYTLSNLIELFRPKFDENKNEDDCFLEACNFASIIFDLIIKEAISKVKALNTIKEKILDIKDKILILDEFIPYEFAIFKLNLDIDFVVHPSNRGGFTGHTIPTSYRGFVSRVPFKEEWAGLKDEELQKVSGVKTARFCHNKRFLVTCETKEDVLKLIYLSKNYN